MITCWNGKELLRKNLPSVTVAAQNPKNKIKEILVVDDASSDDSVAFVQTNFSFVRVVSQPRNFGYAVTCNTGVKEAKEELVVILNADVAPTKNFLEAVLPHFQDKKVFAVSFNEGQFGPGKIVWEKGFLAIEKTRQEKETTVSDWANGGSAIFRKEIWLKLGGMDELFLPFYWEDIDLGLRAKKAGFQIYWEPGAKVDHHHESTVNEANFEKYRFRKNISLIKERNHLLLTWKNIDSLGRFFVHLDYLGQRTVTHPGYLKVIWAALTRKVTF